MPIIITGSPILKKRSIMCDPNGTRRSVRPPSRRLRRVGWPRLTAAREFGLKQETDGATASGGSIEAELRAISAAGEGELIMPTQPDSSGYSGRTETEKRPLGADQTVRTLAPVAAFRNAVRSAPLIAKQVRPGLVVFWPDSGSTVSGQVTTCGFGKLGSSPRIGPTKSRISVGT